MQTREQRIAEGWAECWGLRNVREKSWWCHAGWLRSPDVRGRVDFKSEAEAGKNASPHFGIEPRRFWRKRKAAPIAVYDVGPLAGLPHLNRSERRRMWLTELAEIYEQHPDKRLRLEVYDR